MKDDKEELKNLIAQVERAINKAEASLDTALETVERCKNSITMFDSRNNLLYVIKDKHGGYKVEDGRDVAKDKHGFYVLAGTNEILKSFHDLSEDELVEILNVKLDFTIKHTAETSEYLSKALDRLSTREIEGEM